ncbi:malonyl-acyl carrier protein O-methyltransferase BioC [endosymbiont of Ridgeia piscesae]|uniref:Malonyl-[acyl-carrier protein] O-methyltransferase n=2 Tax=endosymbiont of Ridgeia piscesae TaxID=54398 RepID=A0A0T5YX20_9GAMM|nr:malonyl-acyl carrier protein O-methyltransferase BioC [endosymbiont of Ridgeia piscesae]KRT57291.1 malonyl-CoA O-methyltransferase [endosymbiont of Ridgeia piscesae]
MKVFAETPMIDKNQARRSFARAAARYDEVAVLQRETAQRMLERLDYIRHQPAVILDVGAGTGEATAKLAARYRKAQVIALDFALPMLQQARRRGPLFRKPRCLCGDAEQLPLADASVDLIYSNAALQWCNDLNATFRELLRVLRPDGLLMFSTFGPDTLHELRHSWAQVDGMPHVSPFPEMHQVGDALVSAGFADPVVDVERVTLTYEAVAGLMRDLKTLGAHNVTRGRHKGLTGKGRLQAMYQAYEAFRRDGRLPATYEVVYGSAWAPKQRTEDGVTSISLDMFRQGLR